MNAIIDYISTIEKEDFLKIVSTIEQKIYAFENLTSLQDNIACVDNRLGKKKCIIISNSTSLEFSLRKLLPAVTNYVICGDYLDKVDFFSRSVVDGKRPVWYIYDFVRRSGNFA